MTHNLFNESVNIGAKTNEPSLAELVKLYYLKHFTEEVASDYTYQYLEKMSIKLLQQDSDSYDKGYSDGEDQNL